MDSQNQPVNDPPQSDTSPTILAYLRDSLRAAAQSLRNRLVVPPKEPPSPQMTAGSHLSIQVSAQQDPECLQVQTLLPGQDGSQTTLDLVLAKNPPHEPGSLLDRRGRITRPGMLKASKQIGKILAHPLVIALFVYVLVIGIGIERYPVFFFTDEAIEMNLAANFIRDGFTNYYHEFLPTYFIVDNWVNSVGVYIQVIPYLLFGKSVLVTRLVSASVSLVGMLGLALLLKDVFKFKRYWIGIYVMLLTPAWFLHARMAFVYVELAGFYSLFLYFYCRYRAGSDRSLIWAILLGALTFYSHGIGQILMSVTGLLLFLVDFRYHIAAQRRKVALWALLLLVLVFLPFLRYYLAHPGESALQMARRSSYWVNANFTFYQKLGEFFKQYFIAMNPLYWYRPNSIDLIRHTMKDYANELWIMFPFMAFGLVQALRRFRQPAYRTVLIALLVSPIPASSVAVGMARILCMVIPIGILTAIGLHAALEWVERKLGVKGWVVTPLSMTILVASCFFILIDALINGPTWYRDYGLYGMQYGAQQVFRDEALAGLKQDPARQYVISPTWANGTEQFAEFFIPPNLFARVHLGQPYDYMPDIRAGAKDMYFIANQEEFQAIRTNMKFKDVLLKRIIFFPDGTPGFYVFMLSPADNLDQILAADHLKNITPIQGQVKINDVNYNIMYSPLSQGPIEGAFDSDPNTFIRVIEANPLILDLTPEHPVSLHGITFKLNAMDNFTVKLSLYPPGLTEPVIYQQNYRNLPPEQEFTLTFGSAPLNLARIKIEIKDELSGETSLIHVRTVVFH